MKTKKKVPYSIFKKELRKLIKYALKRELSLADYVKTNGITKQQVLETQATCGAPSCILGYAPEVFPRRFKYALDFSDIIIQSKYGDTYGNCIRVFSGKTELNNNKLCRIFDENNSTKRSDKSIVKSRLHAIESSNSYEELNAKIVRNLNQTF